GQRSLAEVARRAAAEVPARGAARPVRRETAPLPAHERRGRGLFGRGEREGRREDRHPVPQARGGGGLRVPTVGREEAPAACEGGPGAVSLSCPRRSNWHSAAGERAAPRPLGTLARWVAVAHTRGGSDRTCGVGGSVPNPSVFWHAGLLPW